MVVVGEIRYNGLLNIARTRFASSRAAFLRKEAYEVADEATDEVAEGAEPAAAAELATVEPEFAEIIY